MRAPRRRWERALLLGVGLACGGRAALDDVASAEGGEAAEERDRANDAAAAARECGAAYCVRATPPRAGAAGAEPSAGSGSSSTGGSGLSNGFGGSASGGGVASGGAAGSSMEGAGFGGTASNGMTSNGMASNETGGSAASGGSSGGQPVAPSGLPLPRAVLGATAIVSDPLRDRFYVAIGANGPGLADGIVVFDPSAGAITAEVSIAANPDSLAISDDGSTLWVGLHDTSSVLRVDVSGEVPVPVAEYPLPPTDSPPYAHAAGPMLVLPGTTSSLAVSLHYDALSPSLAGVVVLDEGVARPLRLPGHTGASRLTRGPDGYLLGFNNLHTGFGVYSILVSADGLIQREHPNLISGFDTDIAYDGNLLFGTDGAVVSVVTPDFPFSVGWLPVAGPMIPDVAAGSIWVLQGGTPPDYLPLALVLVSLTTLEVLDRTEFGAPLLTPRHFVRGAGGAFAFIADASDSSASELESAVYWLRP